MINIMSNEDFDIFEVEKDINDIVDITLVEKATIRHKKTNGEYFNGTFLKITNRKGETRVLDLIAHIDITNMLEELDILYSKKTKEKPIFCGE